MSLQNPRHTPIHGDPPGAVGIVHSAPSQGVLAGAGGKCRPATPQPLPTTRGFTSSDEVQSEGVVEGVIKHGTREPSLTMTSMNLLARRIRENP